jgi:NAD(P)-dependent dehydrogenase (short-subunit alcohol dehydrogenase family)
VRFQNKVVFITGAASGIGRAIALAFAAEGAEVIAADMLEEEGAATTREIQAAGGKAYFLKLDVASRSEWQAAVEFAVAKCKGIDILINNAGISGTAFSEVLDLEAWNRLMSINADSVFLGTHYFVPVLRERGGGVIINMSSISAIRGQSNVHFGYNASKAAVRILSKSTAVQFGRDGIRCCSVHPGLMEPMRTSGNVKDPGVRAKFIERVPLGRTGVAADVVKPVLFLASDDASYITGIELYVDGGYLAG